MKNESGYKFDVGDMVVYKSKPTVEIPVSQIRSGEIIKHYLIMICDDFIGVEASRVLYEILGEPVLYEEHELELDPSES